MDGSWLSPCYQLVGELLLHPGERDSHLLEELTGRLQAAAPAAVGEALAGFLADPSAVSAEEYVATLELSPPCPLYLGAYLFEEPTTCRDVGTSGRNAYMLELTGLYGHFGFELSSRELPDYLPIIVDFLWVSLVHHARDRIGLRRRLLETLVEPALAPLLAKLQRYESAYAVLIDVLGKAVAEDLRRIGDTPAWQPPASDRQPVAAPSGDLAREEVRS